MQSRLRISPEPPLIGKYSIPYARPELLSSSKAEVFRQSVSGYSYYMELYAYDVKAKTFFINSVVKRSAIVFCYALKGQVDSFSQLNRKTTTLMAEQYAGFYLSRDTYRLKLQKGSHVFLYFALKKEYLYLLSLEYPTLSLLIDHLFAPGEIHAVLPICRIGFRVKRIIKRLQNCREEGETQNLTLLNLMLELLTIYQEQIRSGNQLRYKTSKETAYQVKEYLAKNYTKAGDYSISNLAQKYHISPRTLIREFKNISGTTIRQHLIKLRMEQALRLLTEENKTVKDTATAIGYSDIYCFSKAFKKFYGCPPKEARALHYKQKKPRQ